MHSTHIFKEQNKMYFTEHPSHIFFYHPPHKLQVVQSANNRALTNAIE